MGKKVLITGVNGFLGSALWKYLKAKRSSFEVFGIDRNKLWPSHQISVCDLNNQKKFSNFISRIKPDYIFHLTGGQINVERNLLKTNILATKSLLETVTGINNYYPRVIIPGSAAEYGRTLPVDKPIREMTPARPVSFYGFVKNTETNLGLMHARAGVDVIVARVFNVCGYGMPPNLSLGNFSKQIVSIKKGNKKPVLQVRNLGMKRDFLDTQDVCSAFLELARRGKSGQIYNVCSGHAYLMRDLLKKLISFAQIDNITIEEGKRETQGVDVSIGSNAKIKRSTGWKPKVNIDQGLKKTLRYYQCEF